MIGATVISLGGFASQAVAPAGSTSTSSPADYLAKFNVAHVPDLGVNSFAPGQTYTPINIPRKPKRHSTTLDIPTSMMLSTLGSCPRA